jgi:copper transport protein
LFAVVIAVVGVLSSIGVVPTVAHAHADIQQAEPAAGSAVTAPPTVLRLRFTEPLDQSATRVEIVDERGTRIEPTALTVGPPSDRVLTVEVNDLAEGVYTVRWWSLSQVDGHRWQGTYRFGVGRTPPPSDDAQAPVPTGIEVALQWLALATTSLVLGGLAFRVWAVEPVLDRLGDAPRARHRLDRLLLVSLVLLGIVSVAEAVGSYGIFSAVRPPGGYDLSVLGKTGALALLRLFLVPMIGYLAAPSGSAAMSLAFAALLVLTRSQAGHAAAGGLGPVLVDATHQLAGCAWLGGAATFALLLPVLLRERSSLAGPIGARFGQLALAAAGVAVASGVVSGWALGLDPTRLPDSRYGQSLLAKLGLVVLLLGAAFIVWRQRTARPKQLLNWPLCAELVFGAGVLLTAGALALLPPPAESSALPLDMAQPAGRDGALRLHLILDRVRVGQLQAEVRVVDAEGRALGQTDVSVSATELAPFDGPAGSPPPPFDGNAEEGPEGQQIVTFSPFGQPGWWRLTVNTTIHLQGHVSLPFDLLVPDPNRTTLDPPASDPAAADLFAATISRMERLRSVRQRDALADGIGGVTLSTARFAAPDRYEFTTAEGDASVAVGPTQAYRHLDEPWRVVRRTSPFRFPSYRDTYDGSSAHHLGHDATLDGAAMRILTFYVARDRAWYCWWIDAETGLVRREAMVGPSQYRSISYDEFDAPVTIELPAALTP